MAHASRSLRRHHVTRTKNATRKIGRHLLRRAIGESEDAYAERLDAWTNRTYQHRKTCSCEICRNPRHSALRRKDRLTVAERRAVEAEADPLS